MIHIFHQDVHLLSVRILNSNAKDMQRREVITMKKMLAIAAICAGVFVFTNTNFAEAADQQSKKITSITQTTDTNTQQLSTKRDKDDD